MFAGSTPRQFCKKYFTERDERKARSALRNLGAEIRGNTLRFPQGISHNTEKIIDSELVHLRELTDIRWLYLYETQITDAGLVHLKGMTTLKELGLTSTKVTDAGVAQLQKALPNCKIEK